MKYIIYCPDTTFCEAKHTQYECISFPAITYRNPCTLDNGKVCEHSCLRLPNTVICTCPDGHFLHSNRYKCIGKCIHIFALKTLKTFSVHQKKPMQETFRLL